MNQIGEITLVIALILSAYAAVGVVIGARRKLPELVSSARAAVWVAFGLTTIASAALFYAFLTHDFSLSYVYQYSSRSQSLAYLVSAFWAGQEGSLLLWALVLSMFAAIVVQQTRSRNQDLAPYVLLVVMLTLTFFLGILNFASRPFASIGGVPADGNGLNPLLENAGMFFHPTTLYLGYVGFTIPFAFCIAALITGRLGDQWIKSTRRWTLFAWMFLGLGNLIGAWWAYNELGWGG
ncbi:MAG: cytochrome c biogenesis protein CcsA, partial [Chloroflexi bacterium]|nr:cytochrome c biogenesis protein CcsA [Chloroflexota bacterium]